MNIKLKYIFLIISGIFLEFLRDYCFININVQIKYLKFIKSNYTVENYTDSYLLYFLKFMSIKNLIFLKFLLSLIFIILFYYLGYGFSMISFNNEKHINFNRLLKFSGIAILLLSIVIYSIKDFLNVENQLYFYNISVDLSHFLQSILYPITFLMIFYGLNLKKI